MSDMPIKNTPDYEYVKEQALKAYDIIAALTFETHFDDISGGELIKYACTSIAALYLYAKQKEEDGK